MDIIAFKKLRVGDVVYTPGRSPFPTHPRVVKGVENTTVTGKYNPYVKTISMHSVFPWEVESVESWEDNDRPLPPPWDKLVKLGDPLFENEGDNEVS